VRILPPRPVSGLRLVVSHLFAGENTGQICSKKEVLIFSINLGGHLKIMARMTQTEIINALAEKAALKKTEIKALFDALAELATKEVKKNGEFTLPGFGKLKKTNRKARDGRNPATGAVIKIPAKTTVKFSLGKAMKDAVSSK
ncbi:MAG: HU family DNA-binding protein, partial [Pyrinomonadaceae bacterium]